MVSFYSNIIQSTFNSSTLHLESPFQQINTVFYQKPNIAKSNPIQEEVKMFVESIVNNLDNDLTIPKALNSIEISQLVAEKVKLAAMIIE